MCRTSVFFVLISSACYGLTPISAGDGAPPRSDSGDAGHRQDAEQSAEDSDVVPQEDADDTVDADADWDDEGYLQPPVVGEDEVVAELIGSPITVDNEEQGGGPPSVVWNGTGWGVAWGEPEGAAVFRPLDELASPLGPPVVASPEVTGWFATLAWNGSSYAIAAVSPWERNMRMALIDEMGGLLFEPSFTLTDTDHPHVSWSSDAGGWILGYTVDREILAVLVDHTGVIVGESHRIGDAIGHGPRVVSPKGRIAFVWGLDDGVVFRSVTWPPVDSVSSPTTVLPYRSFADSYIEAESYVDLVVVVAMDGSDVLAAVVDTRTDNVIAEPTMIGDSSISDRRPGVAAAVERGYLGVCYEIGAGPYGGAVEGSDGVDFRLITPQGSPLGAVVTVVDDLRNIGGCAVGWNGDEFIVVYWSCGGGGEWNTILAQRVRPLV